VSDVCPDLFSVGALVAVVGAVVVVCVVVEDDEVEGAGGVRVVVLLILVDEVDGGTSVCCVANTASFCVEQTSYALALALAESSAVADGHSSVRQTRASSPSVNPLALYSEHRHETSPSEQSYC
jgi:hypothetical protein